MCTEEKKESLKFAINCYHASLMCNTAISQKLDVTYDIVDYSYM